MRQLASIQKIKQLDPILGKDRIVLASFESVGWKVICGKSDFQIGDLCIYCEVDSILPVKPEFEFLRKRCWAPKWNGFRIRNMSMSGIYSEGIVFPISILTDKYPNHVLTEGIDVTEEIGVIKFDPEALEEEKLIKQDKHGPIIRYLLRFKFIKNLFYPKRAKRGWPEWASQTDETRAQILPYIYEDYQGEEVYATEKIDGQSLTAGYVNNRFSLCSRKLGLPKPSKIKGKFAAEKSKYWQTVGKYELEQKLKKASKDLGISLYIQGEQCGPTIQGNKYGFTELKFFVYNIFDVTHKRYFGLNEMVEFCKQYDLKMVQWLFVGLFEWKSIDELVMYAKGKSVYADIPREGVVIRSVDPKPPGHKMSNMLSFKVINPDFSLKYGNEE